MSLRLNCTLCEALHCDLRIHPVIIKSWLGNLIVSFVTGPYSVYALVKRVVKWKFGKENPFIHRVVRYEGVGHDGVFKVRHGQLGDI